MAATKRQKDRRQKDRKTKNRKIERQREALFCKLLNKMLVRNCWTELSVNAFSIHDLGETN